MKRIRRAGLRGLGHELRLCVLALGRGALGGALLPLGRADAARPRDHLRDGVRVEVVRGESARACRD